MKNPISILIFALTVLLLTALIFSVDVNASNIVGTGSFHAGGDTTAEVTLFGSSSWDSAGSSEIYWWPTSSNVAATIIDGSWSNYSYNGAYTWSGWICSDADPFDPPTNSDRLTWYLPELSNMQTAGTVWLTVRADDTGTWSGNDIVWLVSLRNETTTCYNDGGYQSGLFFYLFNSGDIDPAWDFIRFDCGGTPYSRRTQYFGGGAANTITGGWDRVAFTWKFEGGDLYLSYWHEDTWYDDSYDTGPACTGPTDDFYYFEVGGECEQDATPERCTDTGDGDMNIAEVYITDGYKSPDPMP